MRLFFYLLLFSTFLCTCDSAPNTTNSSGKPDGLVGTVNYLADQGILTVNLQVLPQSGGPISNPPRAFGFAMDTVPRAAPGTYKFRKPMAYPSVVALSVPCRGTECEVDVKLSPVFVDSFPNEIPRGQNLSVTYGSEPLTKDESVVFFFDPKDRSVPKQIKLVGPTDDATATLPADALADLEPGAYDLYLIKQQLRRDSTASLRSSIQSEYITRTRLVSVTE